MSETIAQFIGIYALEFILTLTIFIIIAIILLWRLFEQNYAKLWLLLNKFWQYVKNIRFIKRLLQRYQSPWTFLRNRLSPDGYLGLHLTLGMLLTFIAISFFMTIAGEVLENENIVHFDQELALALHQNASPTAVMILKIVTAFAGRPASIIIGGGVGILLLVFRKKLLLISWIVAILGNSALNAGLKALFQRTRPEFTNPFLVEPNWSFPSGHAMGALLMYGMLAYLLILTVHRYLNKLILMSMVVALILVIGFSRLLLGAHFFSDVVGGYAAATAWLTIVITGTEIARRREHGEVMDSPRETIPTSARSGSLSTSSRQ